MILSFLVYLVKHNCSRHRGLRDPFTESLFIYKTWLVEERIGIVTVTNTSVVALPLSSIEIGGADAVHYVITDTVYEVSNTTDGILDAGKSMDVTVKFEPNGGLLSSGAEVTLSNAQIKIFLNIDTGYPTGENPLEISPAGLPRRNLISRCMNRMVRPC